MTTDSKSTRDRIVVKRRRSTARPIFLGETGQRADGTRVIVEELLPTHDVRITFARGPMRLGFVVLQPEELAAAIAMLEKARAGGGRR